MDSEISGLFSSAAADFIYLYLDYGAFAYDSEGEDYEEKDCWSGADFSRCDFRIYAFIKNVYTSVRDVSPTFEKIKVNMLLQMSINNKCTIRFTFELIKMQKAQDEYSLV